MLRISLRMVYSLFGSFISSFFFLFFCSKRIKPWFGFIQLTKYFIAKIKIFIFISVSKDVFFSFRWRIQEMPRDYKTKLLSVHIPNGIIFEINCTTLLNITKNCLTIVTSNTLIDKWQTLLQLYVNAYMPSIHIQKLLLFPSP